MGIKICKQCKKELSLDRFETEKRCYILKKNYLPTGEKKEYIYHNKTCKSCVWKIRCLREGRNQRIPNALDKTPKEKKWK